MDKHQIVETLYKKYSKQGFITEDEALSVFAEHNATLPEIDSLTEQLLIRGVIIKPYNSEDEDDEYDRGQTDFQALYDDVIKIDPSLDSYVSYVSKIQPPQHREWKMLIPQYKSGNKYALTRLFEMYLRSVIKIAFSFSQKFNAVLADTIQDGNIGLLNSFEKYDMTTHGVFQSYYPMWVMQNITRNMPFSPNPCLYFPVHIRDRLYKLYDNVVAAGGIGVADLSSPILIKSVTDELNCTIEEAQYLLHFFKPIQSIEDLIGTQPELFFDDSFEVNMIENIDKTILGNVVEKLLSELNPRETEVLQLRYGLDRGKERTLEEVGCRFNLTRERIRQIESNAIKKLSMPMRAEKLKSFIDIFAESVPDKSKIEKANASEESI